MNIIGSLVLEGAKAAMSTEKAKKLVGDSLTWTKQKMAFNAGTDTHFVLPGVVISSSQKAVFAMMSLRNYALVTLLRSGARRHRQAHDNSWQELPDHFELNECLECYGTEVNAIPRNAPLKDDEFGQLRQKQKMLCTTIKINTMGELCEQMETPEYRRPIAVVVRLRAKEIEFYRDIWEVPAPEGSTGFPEKLPLDAKKSVMEGYPEEWIKMMKEKGFDKVEKIKAKVKKYTLERPREQDGCFVNSDNDDGGNHILQGVELTNGQLVHNNGQKSSSKTSEQTQSVVEDLLNLNLSDMIMPSAEAQKMAAKEAKEAENKLDTYYLICAQSGITITELGGKYMFVKELNTSKWFLLPYDAIASLLRLTATEAFGIDVQRTKAVQTRVEFTTHGERQTLYQAF